MPFSAYDETLLPELELKLPEAHWIQYVLLLKFVKILAPMPNVSIASWTANIVQRMEQTSNLVMISEKHNITGDADGWRRELRRKSLPGKAEQGKTGLARIVST